MTKSTITRERLQEIAEDGFLKHGESKELARMVLAAIDSEPVVFTDERNLHRIAVGRETALIWGKQNQEGGDIPLYRHAQPAPVVPDRYIFEANVGGSTWVQCSEKAFENAKSKGELTRVLYEYPSAAVFLKD